MLQLLLKSFFYSAVFLLVSWVSGVAFASTGSSLHDPVTHVLCWLSDMSGGAAGKAIATIALVFLAVGLFVGKITWGVAVSVVVGIAVMFGAPRLVDAINGKAIEGCMGAGLSIYAGGG